MPKYTSKHVVDLVLSLTEAGAPFSRIERESQLCDTTIRLIQLGKWKGLLYPEDRPRGFLGKPVGANDFTKDARHRPIIGSRYLRDFCFMCVRLVGYCERSAIRICASQISSANLCTNCRPTSERQIVSERSWLEGVEF